MIPSHIQEQINLNRNGGVQYKNAEQLIVHTEKFIPIVKRKLYGKTINNIPLYSTYVLKVTTNDKKMIWAFELPERMEFFIFWIY